MNKESHLYTPFYCEENIWHLCHSPSFSADSKVVLISNDLHSCPLWKQRAGSGPDKFVVWDYHAVLLDRQGSWQVWDLDTVLALPTDFRSYLDATFKIGELELNEHAPLFRVIDAAEYASCLSSDRSHMRNPDGSWKAKPPAWPTIQGAGASNLMQLIDMTRPDPGKVMNIAEFSRAFS
jgi:protein N-terminal glutamine amidohydrolase